MARKRGARHRDRCPGPGRLRPLGRADRGGPARRRDPGAARGSRSSSAGRLDPRLLHLTGRRPGRPGGGKAAGGGLPPGLRDRGRARRVHRSRVARRAEMLDSPARNRHVPLEEASRAHAQPPPRRQRQGTPGRLGEHRRPGAPRGGRGLRRHERPGLLERGGHLRRALPRAPGPGRRGQLPAGVPPGAPPRRLAADVHSEPGVGLGHALPARLRRRDQAAGRAAGSTAPSTAGATSSCGTARSWARPWKPAASTRCAGAATAKASCRCSRGSSATRPTPTLPSCPT